MRVIPAAVQTLLKSRAQAGANAHNHLITLTGAPLSTRTFANSVVKTEGMSATTNNRISNWVETTDGRFISAYTGADLKIYLYFCATEAEIFGNDYPATSVVDSGLTVTTAICNYQVSMYRDAEAGLLMFVNDSGGKKVLCYKSASGNGDDFALLSTVYSWGDYPTHGQVSVPCRTSTGRLVVSYIAMDGFGWAYLCVSTSDDEGATWTQRWSWQYFNHASAIGQVAQIPDGTLYVILSCSSGACYLGKSVNDGTNWAIVTTVSDTIGAINGTLYYDSTSDTLYIVGGGTIYAVINPTVALVDDPTNWESVYPAFADDAVYSRVYKMPSGDLQVVYQNSNSWTHLLGVGTITRTIRAKRIEINRNKGMASSATVVFDNKAGIYSPDKGVGEDWKNIMWPNNGIIIKQGYGQELETTFTGTIDDVVMSTFPAEITLVCRDYMKRAYDQLITSGGTHSITYNNFTPEAMFAALAELAGWAAGDIHTEVTGLTIAEKIFTNETYGDAFSWLADMCGFMVFCDEDGDIYYIKDDDDAVPTSDYEFAEGEDIVSLGYTISDRDLYNKVIVVGDGVAYEATYVNTYGILAQKKMIIQASEATTEAQCQAIAEQAVYVMNARARICDFAAIANPYIQIKDTLTVTETTTLISELYNITDISTVQSPDGGYLMNITCYHYAALS